jgi:hypothetical protein
MAHFGRRAAQERARVRVLRGGEGAGGAVDGKSAVRGAAEMPLLAGLAYETELFVTCFASDDKREGVAAFLKKRPGGVHGALRWDALGRVGGRLSPATASRRSPWRAAPRCGRLPCRPAVGARLRQVVPTPGRS